MKIINEIQGTESWREWRHRGIGASDVAKVMKVHPTESPLMLYNEICGFAKKRFVNAAMKRGNDEEPKAIAWLENHFEVKLDMMCAEHSEYPFIRCSFDGIHVENKFLVEIKTPYSAERLAKMIDGDIPIEYIYQIQYQMMITGFDKGIIAIWDSRDAHCHIIEKDEKLQAKMIKEVNKFWNDLIIGKEPPLTNLDFIDKTEELTDLLKNVKELEEAMEMKRQAEENIKRLKQLMEEKAFGENIIIGNMKMKNCEGRCSYDMEAMKEDAIDVDKYKRKGKDYYRYSFN